MRSKVYLDWIAEADTLFLMQKQKLLNQQLVGEFHALLELYPPDKRRRDGDNYFKAPMDYATRIGLIKDDSYCTKGTFHWIRGENGFGVGCRLTIWDTR
jgi:Holliday junction resolvase RusA-like endonuclease